MRINVLMIVAALSCATFAQDAAPPIDQAVGDLDLLSTSMRHARRGFDIDRAQGGLYRVGPSVRPGYIRLSPGVTARVDRVDYLVRRGRKGHAKNIAPQRDGEYRERVPANTLFVLTPVNVAYKPRQGTGVDRRLNARIDTKLDLRVRLHPAYRDQPFLPSGHPSRSLSIR